MLSKRRFGIEIECGHPWGHSRIGRYIEEKGVECDDDYDGSGCELRIGPLEGQDGFNAVHTAMEAITETGGYVTRSDGMHIHLEAEDFIGKPKLQATLVRSWLNLEPAIEQIVAPYRRRGTGACPKVWNKSKARVSHLTSKNAHEGRGNLNLSNIVLRKERGEIVYEKETYTDYYGTTTTEEYCVCCGEPRGYCYMSETPPTVEIRWHEGNLDPEVAVAWVTMGQRLLDVVAEGGYTIRACNRPATLGSRLGLERDIVTTLVKKAATVDDPSPRDRYDYY